MGTRRWVSSLVAAVLVTTPMTLLALSPKSVGPEAKQMAAAASAFLQALNADQRKLATHAFDGGDRETLHFVPMVRSGIPLNRLTPKQRSLAHALVKTGLSKKGYGKATQIMELETVLAEMEKNPVRRNPHLYYTWVFGKPKADGVWGWKFEGHHLSVNVTLVGGDVVVFAPSFLGANPAHVKTGRFKGRRVLAAEEDIARKLVLSFDKKAREKVVFREDAPDDIVTSQESTTQALDTVGILAKDMTKSQQELLRQLISEHAATLPDKEADRRLRKIDEDGFGKLRFGWAGETETGQRHYYRIAGSGFLIEYDNTQNGANHVHTAWRDHEGDFGRDHLREHLKQAHGKAVQAEPSSP